MNAKLSHVRCFVHTTFVFQMVAAAVLLLFLRDHYSLVPHGCTQELRVFKIN